MRVLITLYSLTTMNLPDPDIKLAFRQRREKAMTLGDRESVAVLGQFLLYMGDRLGTTQHQIVAQLGKECGFDVGHAIQELHMQNGGQLELTKHLES